VSRTKIIQNYQSIKNLYFSWRHGVREQIEEAQSAPAASSPQPSHPASGAPLSRGPPAPESAQSAAGVPRGGQEVLGESADQQAASEIRPSLLDGGQRQSAPEPHVPGQDEPLGVGGRRQLAQLRGAQFGGKGTAPHAGQRVLGAGKTCESHESRPQEQEQLEVQVRLGQSRQGDETVSFKLPIVNRVFI